MIFYVRNLTKLLIYNKIRVIISSRLFGIFKNNLEVVKQG